MEPPPRTESANLADMGHDPGVVQEDGVKQLENTNAQEIIATGYGYLFMKSWPAQVKNGERLEWFDNCMVNPNTSDAEG